jgi:GntR family transcriptional regulator
MTEPPDIVVDMSSPMPPFEQVRYQLESLIVSGVLRADQRLPPVRQLAGDLGLAVGTVARAYRELETAGLIRSRRGGGTSVVSPSTTRSASERRALLRERSRAHVQGMRLLGASESEMIAVLKEVLG